MPLDIYWRIESKTQAKTLIKKLRQRALDLPFLAVSEVVRLVGEETRITDVDDPWHCLKLVAQDWLWDEDGDPWLCPPDEIVGFQIEVAPGSDSAEFYFASYPAGLLTETGIWLPTTRTTWSGAAQCDVQFASHPRCGGAASFVRAHSALCRLLDYAKELGILANVNDETGFFDHRDVAALVKRVDQCNALTAAVAGAFKDAGRRSSSPILTFPNYEHLEAKGLEKIGPDLEGLKRMEPESE
jgi:hypothetical protein